jgi:type I site-specific restriction endonuclease
MLIKYQFYHIFIKLLLIVQLPKLNFPEFEFRFQKNEKGTIQVFDIIRKKFIDITPEEWVRQHIVHFLIQHKQVPSSMISIEKQLILNNTKRRTDIVIFNSLLKPLLIIECKAPQIEINQLTINQALRYNIELKVPAIFLSNGLQHVFLKLENEGSKVLKEIPDYQSLLNF